MNVGVAVEEDGLAHLLFDLTEWLFAVFPTEVRRTGTRVLAKQWRADAAVSTGSCPARRAMVLANEV